MPLEKPTDMKKLGKNIRGLNRKRWRQRAQEIIFPGILAKHEQNTVCHDYLLASGCRNIAEAS
jgi:predicted NAD-dependent protein-ADP-ribosyltransferase YbiA (DUF1768 family)